MTDRETLARLIANALGDNFADAFKNKKHWIAKRGQSGGRNRDINEPMQGDYLDAADAILASDWLAGVKAEARRAGMDEAARAFKSAQYEPAPYTTGMARLRKLAGEE